MTKLDLQQDDAELAPGSAQWNHVLHEEMNARRLPKWWLDTRYLIGRFFIRTGRVLAGALIGVLAAYVLLWAIEILGKPLASQSLLGIIAGLAGGVFGIALIPAAFTAAFGEGEPREDYNARIENDLRAHVEMLMKVEPWRIRTRRAAYRQAQERGQASYELGRHIGRFLRH